MFSACVDQSFYRVKTKTNVCQLFEKIRIFKGRFFTSVAIWVYVMVYIEFFYWLKCRRLAGLRRDW